MKKVKFVAFFLSMSFVLPNAHSMENGINAENDGRTLAIVSEVGKVCSGFLYSDRIVLTAGHCTFNNERKIKFNSLYVTYPGEKYTKNNKIYLVEKVFISENWDWHGEENFSDKDDFAVLVLKDSIPVYNKVFIASQEQINSFLENKILVTNVAYGRQNINHFSNDDTVPQFAQFPLVPMSLVEEKLQSAWAYLGKKKYYGMKVHIKQIPGGPSSCSGDSGSPFYVKSGEDFIYLGALSWGVGGLSNCSGKPWIDPIMYMGSVAAYDFVYLINMAEEYLNIQKTLINEIKKKTIKCIKNKKVKKITAINPKCPAKYKLKV